VCGAPAGKRYSLDVAASEHPRLRVAALQLSSQADVAENLAKIEALVTEAAQRGAELALLPENFAYFGPEGGKREFAERLGDLEAPVQRALKQLATRLRIGILAGGFAERSSDAERPFNTSLLLTRDGEVTAVYRKIHLFDVDLRAQGSACESLTTTPGSDVVVAPFAGFNLGLSICYDLRFPELYRKLVERGADVLTVPAAFTQYTGKDHWHVLLRARAIEAQSYVVAPAQWGKHPENRLTFGHALIVDPWGTVIAEASDRVGFVIADVERNFLDEVRSRIPSLQNRRL